ncbi:MAG: DNA polymerase ligase N-terminal domain-containing protein [Alphaproteobacteria bacterium]
MNRSTGLHFVVQKHHARNLHYDLRLEWSGVLKSWAVPKGPSKRPGERRLAVEVEDHPLEYRHFEGVIPPKHYGAGMVKIWDRGTWRPEGDVAAGLRKGSLSFSLSGAKLRGRWTLVRTKGRRAQSYWLLIKRRDPPRQRSA